MRHLKTQHKTPAASKLDGMRRKIIATSTALLLGLSLTACDSKDEGTITPPEETVVEQSTEVVEETTEEEPTKANPTFGDTYTWPDGLAVTISQPEEFTPTEAAAGTVDGQTNLVYDVTVTNNTDEDFDAIMLNLTVASGGKEGSAIFDTDIDMPTSTITPGKSLTWKAAFSVADPEDVQLTVDNMIDMDNGKVHFTN